MEIIYHQYSYHLKSNPLYIKDVINIKKKKKLVRIFSCKNYDLQNNR